jgi:hypothetical protein
LISYDSSKDSGLNVGLNGVASGNFQTVDPDETRSYIWYAGNISSDGEGARVLTPVEFGGVNMTASDLLLQGSYGFYGALVIEPQGSKWDASENHELSAKIKDSSGKLLFTEVIVLGASTKNAMAGAGSEVRFRVLNPNVGTAGQVSDSTNLITIEGHNWPEEPYVEDSTVIEYNEVSQTMGSQQVTSLESYNMVLTSAGGVEKLPGDYEFYYYPAGPSKKTRLGTLTVTPE